MILNALCDYYDALARRGEVTPPGWSVAKVSFALDLDGQGVLRGIIPLKVKPEGGAREIPQSLQVPEQVKRASGIAANFLCENSAYFLGIDEKGKPERSRQCFDSAKELHWRILESVDSPAARAVIAYFDAWMPERAAEHPVLLPYLTEILKGANLIFSVDGLYVHTIPAVRAAREAYRSACSAEVRSGLCLVTGRKAPIARLHPAIKGVQGAQSVGASLVSFNAAAFESYGHEQADGTYSTSRHRCDLLGGGRRTLVSGHVLLCYVRQHLGGNHRYGSAWRDRETGLRRAGGRERHSTPPGQPLLCSGAGP